MSTKSRSRPTTRGRLLPPGYGPPSRRLELAPDGWEPLGLSRPERMLVGFDLAALRASRAMANGVSRRELLKRMGQIGLVVGLGMGTTILSAQPAYARCFQCGDPCGPSPFCGSANCKENGNCRQSVQGVEKRQHDNFDCFDCGSGYCNCWVDDCCACSEAQKKWCCDCCKPGTADTRVHFTVQFKGRLHLQHADWVLMMVHTSLLLGSMALGAWVALLQLDGA